MSILMRLLLASVVSPVEETLGTRQSRAISVGVIRVKNPFKRLPARLIVKFPEEPSEVSPIVPLSAESTRRFASDGKRIGTPFSRGIKSVILVE